MCVKVANGTTHNTHTHIRALGVKPYARAVSYFRVAVNKPIAQPGVVGRGRARSSFVLTLEAH